MRDTITIEQPVLVCELCGDPIPASEQDAAVTTPDGWWCAGCTGRIEEIEIRGRR